MSLSSTLLWLEICYIHLFQISNSEIWLKVTWCNQHKFLSSRFYVSSNLCGSKSEIILQCFVYHSIYIFGLFCFIVENVLSHTFVLPNIEWIFNAKSSREICFCWLTSRSPLGFNFFESKNWSNWSSQSYCWNSGYCVYITLISAAILYK